MGGLEHVVHRRPARRSHLAAEHAQIEARLRGIEHRLPLIEKEQTLSGTEHVIKPLPRRTIAAGRARVASQPEIAGVIEPLFEAVAKAVTAAGGSLQTPVAVYEWDAGTEEVAILAGYEYAGAPAPGFDVVTLPPAENAVCAVHLGAMDTVAASWQALLRWTEEQGWTPDAPCREVYVRAWPPDDQSGWVTELQQPVRRA